MSLAAGVSRVLEPADALTARDIVALATSRGAEATIDSSTEDVKQRAKDISGDGVEGRNSDHHQQSSGYG